MAGPVKRQEQEAELRASQEMHAMRRSRTKRRLILRLQKVADLDYTYRLHT